MPDLTQISANVHTYKGARVITVQIGEAVIAGDQGYHDFATDKHYKTEIDNTENVARATGMFLQDGVIDDFILFAVGGPVDIGATLDPGKVYAPSINSGKWRLASEASTGNYITISGVAVATDKMLLHYIHSGVQIL